MELKSPPSHRTPCLSQIDIDVVNYGSQCVESVFLKTSSMLEELY
jgi:hypothetical protein